MNKWATFFKDLMYILQTSPKQSVLQSGCSNFRKYPLKNVKEFKFSKNMKLLSRKTT